MKFNKIVFNSTGAAFMVLEEMEGSYKVVADDGKAGTISKLYVMNAYNKGRASLIFAA